MTVLCSHFCKDAGQQARLFLLGCGPTGDEHEEGRQGGDDSFTVNFQFS